MQVNLFLTKRQAQRVFARVNLILAGSTILLCSLANAQTYSILPLGDSITDGNTGGNNLTNDGGYRTQLATTLQSRGYTINFLGSRTTTSGSASTPTPAILANNLQFEGHPGYTISQLNSDLDGLGYQDSTSQGGYWLSGGNGTGRSAIFPNIILLHIGTNDIINDYGTHSTAGTPMSASTLLPQMEADMTTLVHHIVTDRPGSHLIVSSIIPFPNPFVTASITGYPNPSSTQLDQTDYALNHYVILYNQWIATTLVPEFQALGDKVTFIDSYTGFIGFNSSGDKIIEPYYGDYGLHPDTQGYNQLGSSFATAVQAIPEPVVSPLVVLTLFAMRRRNYRKG